MNFIKKLDGWKRIIGYVLLNIPFLTPYPLLGQAIAGIINNPADPTNIGNLVINTLMLAGVFDGAKKNLRK